MRKIGRINPYIPEIRTNPGILQQISWKCVADFKNRILWDFRDTGIKWAIDIGVEKDFPAADIEEGYIVFANDEILSCFERPVNRMLEAIKNQIGIIKQQDKRLKVCTSSLISGMFLICFIDHTRCRGVGPFAICIPTNKET